MRSALISAAAVVLAGVQTANAQTFSECNPMKNSSCPPNPALGTSKFYDFTKTKSLPADFSALPGTTPEFSETDGLVFSIKTVSNAPTIAFSKYIMHGKIEAYVKAAAGGGIVSSVILLSDTLDEIDWEWVGGDNANVQSNFFGKANTESYDREKHIAVNNPFGSIHKYTIEWTKDKITWSVDDLPALTRVLLKTDPLTEGGLYYPQTPMQVKLGNWVGCPSKQCFDDASCATHGTCGWVGTYYEELSKPPFEMSITNITISDYSCAKEYSYSDNSGMLESIVGADGECDNSQTSTVTDGSTKSTTKSSDVPQTTGDAPPLNLGQGNNTLTSGVAKATDTKSQTGSSTSPPTTSGSLVVDSAASLLKVQGASGLVQVAVMALGLAFGALLL